MIDFASILKTEKESSRLPALSLLSCKVPSFYKIVDVLHEGSYLLIKDDNDKQYLLSVNRVLANKLQDYLTYVIKGTEQKEVIGASVCIVKGSSEHIPAYEIRDLR